MRDAEKLYMSFIAIVVISATFALAYVLLTKVVPESNRDIINVALGTILSLSVTVVNYYFGSSKSSRDKDKVVMEDKQRPEKRIIGEEDAS